MNIKTQIKQLKETFKEKYGLNVDIDIHAHKQSNPLNETKVFAIGEKLSKELNQNFSKRELDDCMVLSSDYGEGIANITLFYDKPKQKINVNRTIKELGDYVTGQLENGNIDSNEFHDITSEIDKLNKLIPKQDRELMVISAAQL
jgi:hypothetical protein